MAQWVGNTVLSSQRLGLLLQRGFNLGPGTCHKRSPPSPQKKEDEEEEDGGRGGQSWKRRQFGQLRGKMLA